jgi:hypothetical protein
MTYRTVIYNGHDGFERARPQWEVLAPHAQFFFQLPQWLENLEADGISWFVVMDDDRPVAAAALSPQRISVFGKGVRLLGGVRPTFDGKKGLDLLFGALAIADPTVDHHVIARALLAGYRHTNAHWDVLWLNQLREGSLWLASGFGHIDQHSNAGAYILDTTMPSSQFWAAATRNLKKGLRGKRRCMEREGRRSAVIEATTPDQVTTAFEHFVELEGRGWKGSTDAFVNQPQTADFVRRFLVSAAKSHRVSVRSLLIDDRLAASQISVQVGDTLFLLKITYDESLHHLSPGNLLMADLVSKACDDPSINRIDCLTRGDWHARWGMAVTPMYRLIMFNPRTLTGFAGGTAWRGLQAIGLLQYFERFESWRASAARSVDSGCD